MPIDHIGQTVHCHTMLAALPAAILLIDAQERIVYVNPAAVQLFQKGSEPVTGSRCGDLFACRNRHVHSAGCGYSVQCRACPVIQAIRQSVSGENGPQTAGEARLDCDQGPTPRWLHFQAGEMVSDGRRFALLTVCEITERRQREEWHRILIDSGPTMVWTSGLDMQCDYFNQPWLTFTGRTLEQECGTGWLDNVHPDDRQRCLRIYTEAFKKQRRFKMSYRVRRHDGVYRWLEDLGQPLRDASGVFVGYIGHCLDVTLRNRARDALRSMRDQFSAVAEYTYDWESWLGPDGRLLWVSPSVMRHTGYSVQECLAMPDYPLGIVYEADRYLLARQLTDSLEARSSANDLSFRVRRKDGGQAWMAQSWAAIYGKDGQWLGMRISARDITDRKRAEDELAQLNQALALRVSVAERFLFVPEERLYEDILNLVLEAMASRLGYFGFIDEAGDLICPSMTRGVWEECRMSTKTIVFPRASWGGLWGAALTQRRALLCNSLLKTPAGHIPLRNALVVPLLAGEKLVGQIVVANKESDYTPADQHWLESLAAFIAPVLSLHLDKERAQQALGESIAALENKNIALNVLLDHRAEEKQAISDAIVKRFDRLVLPYFEKLEKAVKREDVLTYLAIVQSHIRESLASLEPTHNSTYRHFSPTEIQVADLIRQGKTSKEIGQLLNMSPRSVYFHRNNIRRKLKLLHTKQNLKSCLQIPLRSPLE